MIALHAIHVSDKLGSETTDSFPGPANACRMNSLSTETAFEKNLLKMYFPLAFDISKNLSKPDKTGRPYV